ncbi:MAG: hypothetical protein K0B52_04765 [FCB group bacterium]|nr:hypothetical protein [FCB group bacterium]
MRSIISVMICVLGILISACGVKPADYYPLQEGYVWTYNLGDASKLRTVENFAVRAIDKKKVIPQKVDERGRTSFSFVVQEKNGVFEYAVQPAGSTAPRVLDTPRCILKYPVRGGTTWQEEASLGVLLESVPYTMTYTIEKKKETLTVPAGTFENCIKVSGSGLVEKDRGVLGALKVMVSHEIWYAPKVGMVRSIRKESGNHVLTGTSESIILLESFKK